MKTGHGSGQADKTVPKRFRPGMGGSGLVRQHLRVVKRVADGAHTAPELPLVVLLADEHSTESDGMQRALLSRGQSHWAVQRVSCLIMLQALLGESRSIIVIMAWLPSGREDVARLDDLRRRHPGVRWLPSATDALAADYLLDTLVHFFQLGRRCRSLRHSEARNRSISISSNSPLGMATLDADGRHRNAKPVEAGLLEVDAAMYEEMERAQVTLNSIGDAVLSTDLAGKITYLNPMAERMTGWSCVEARGQPLAEVFKLIDGITRLPARSPALLSLEEGASAGLAANTVLIKRDGTQSAIEDSAAPIHNREGKVSGLVIVFRDVSAARAMAQRMSHLAQHDFLTGLPNRVLLTERMSQAIRRAQRHGTQFALLYLDVDYFKHVNDSLGHAIGDRLLQSLAERLGACVRAMDTVCRQGGDEFVILLAEIDKHQDAALVAEKLLVAASVPQRIDEHELHMTLSIGISVYPGDGSDTGALMLSADTAMYHAKAKGRNNYQFFESDMSTCAVNRLALEGGLRRGLLQNEFVLHYQPQVELASGEMTGAEALLRWQDPLLGLVPPAQFVPTAESCGLMIPLGRWVLRETCRQVRAWLDAGLDAVPVAVNISALEFQHKDFINGVAHILADTGLPPHYLRLELTESVLTQDLEASRVRLAALSRMGIQLAVDDFGAGYSSLSYLQHLPISTLKIDQSFLRDIPVGSNDEGIFRKVIAIGRKLKHRVVAEGVETPAQLAFLKSHQCDEGQGFLFSRPLAAAGFEALLHSGAETSHPPVPV